MPAFRWLTLIVLPLTVLPGCGGGVDLAQSAAFVQYNGFLDSLATHADPYNAGDSLVMDNINGLHQEPFDFFNAEGYNIDLEFYYEPLKKEILDHIKKRYAITDAFTADTLREKYLRFSREEAKDPFTVSTVYYVLGYNVQGKGNRTAAISYRTMQSRNPGFELKFNELATRDSIPRTCFSNMAVDSIRFAGRYIALGNACNWQGINNIQCRRLGQMNWSEFQHPRRAVDMLRTQMALSQEKGKAGDIACIDVVFEGHKTKALKMVYKLPLHQRLLTGGKAIIAYYVVAPVRNRYVACILSHYNDDVPEGKLPPLLEEVMQFP